MVTPPPQLEVWVHNVDYNATAEDLALYFRKQKNVPVVKCQMKPGGPRQNTGNATLTLRSVEEYEKFMKRAGPAPVATTQKERRTSGSRIESFMFRDRTLEIKHSSKSSGSAPKDSKKVFSFEAEVRIGVFRGRDEFLLAWNINESALSSSPTHVVVDFQSNCVKISYHDKRTKTKRHIEYHAYDVDGIYNVNVSSANRRFLQRPAHLLRTNMAPKLFEEDLKSSSFVNRFSWELAATDRMGTNAKRTLDFSPNKALSVYRDLLLLHDAPLSDHFIRECADAGWKYDGNDGPWMITENPLRRFQVSLASLERLSFGVKFLLDTLFSERIFYKDLLPVEFYDELSRVPEKVAMAALDDLRRAVQELEGGEDYVNCRPISDSVARLRKTDAFRVYNESHRTIERAESTGKVYRVLVTPLTVQPWGLESDSPNRVLREYDHILDRFVRLSFTDEDGNKLVLKEGKKTAAIVEHFRRILMEGIHIAGRHFEFLGMSNSQMREHSCWFFAEAFDRKTGVVTVRTIQEWMGDFSGINVVAKYAARMGQCFTTTISTRKCRVNEDEFEIIEDTIHTVKKDDCMYEKKKTYNFTDGIGTISPEFAKTVYKSTTQAQGGSQSTPSAFQIRFAGCKGVVAVDPRLSGGRIKLQLRRSMLKFESDHNQVEVCNPSSYASGFLNRQIILLLSTLGVKDKSLLKKQREMLETLEQMLRDTKIAVKYLTLTAALQPDDALTAAVKMMKAGFYPNEEPFVHGVLQSYQAILLDNLRARARIFIESAALLMGVIDETNSLKYGQVFVKIVCQKAGIEPFVVSGHVAVTKNPCFHPGDVRILEAVTVDKLSHLVNVVVFPAKGCRPHTDEISGSDLDGDLYFVTWDPDLLPERNSEPMEYEPTSPLKEKYPITLDDVKDFFIDFIKSDQLGLIANAHLVYADSSLSGANDPKCVKLAELHSAAVDFPKTGVVPNLPDDLRPKAYPDFMQKSNKISYPSRGILNKLFCQVMEFKESAQQTKESPPLLTDGRLRFEGWKDHLEEARALLKDYNSVLLDLMQQYGVQDEWTMITGNVTKVGRFVRHKRIYTVRIEIREKIREVSKAYRKEFYRRIKPFSAAASAKASALYYATYAEDQSTDQRLLSCPWIVAEELTRIKKLNEDSKQ